jgi:hypothetical protein
LPATSTSLSIVLILAMQNRLQAFTIVFNLSTDE